jgi:dipeptidyl aminopeptidase/acylaminoacyl peptidase
MRRVLLLPLALLLVAFAQAPVVSPDGRTAAFVRSEEGNEPGLWIRELATGRERRLLGPRPSEEPKRNLTALSNPVFSLDGGYIYFEASAWATSSAVHQISLRTGRVRFVTDGSLFGVIRNGRWRGHLVVGQHRYFGPPQYGSYDPVSVIRPDGKVMFRAPGSDEDGGFSSIETWLNANGWRL